MMADDRSLFRKRYTALLFHKRSIGHLYYKGGWLLRLGGQGGSRVCKATIFHSTLVFPTTTTEQQFRPSKDERKIGTADSKRRITCA